MKAAAWGSRLSRMKEWSNTRSAARGERPAPMRLTRHRGTQRPLGHASPGSRLAAAASLLVKAGPRVFVGEAATRAKSMRAVEVEDAVEATEGEDAVEGTNIEATEGDFTAVKVTQSEATAVEVEVEIEDTEIEATEGEATVFEVSGVKAAIETTEGEVTEVEAAVGKASVVPTKQSSPGAPRSPHCVKSPS